MIFYTGSYNIEEGSPALNPTGKGLGCFELDLHTGKLEPLGYIYQRSPSYIAISKDKRFLYAAEEGLEKFSVKVFAYKIEENGELSLLNNQPLQGAYACHLAIVNRQLIVANYVSGNALVYPILGDGSLAPVNQIIQHTGHGHDPIRQSEPHIHMICPINNKELFLVDLGLDKVVSYKVDEKGFWSPFPENDILLEPGTGARHMVLGKENKVAYILGELSGELTVFKNIESRYQSIQQISFLPNGYYGKISGAAIRIHPNGRFLYVSERETNTISLFKIDKKSGELTFQTSVSSKGKTPRDFNIDPKGNWLLAANQDSNRVTAFKIQKNGMLQYVSEEYVETPVNVTFL